MAAIFVMTMGLLMGSTAFAQDSPRAGTPVSHVYVTRNDVDLKAYVFRPGDVEPSSALAAIVIFHGGGWTFGEPQWAFGVAQHFARNGMVAVAAQYRLSDQDAITPLEAMSDARAVIRWMRSSATSLGIDPDRIAAYGWSAGGHLAAATAIFTDTTAVESPTAVPNAIVLVSPAVHFEYSRRAQRLLGTRALAREISPAANVREGLPPTLILQGREDTVTPLKDVEYFCKLMRAAGNRCDLRVYPGVGHLFTPVDIPDDGEPQPDPEVKADALEKALEFLASVGLIE